MTCYEHMRKNIRFLTNNNNSQIMHPILWVRKWYERIYSKKKSFHKQTHQSSHQTVQPHPLFFFVY
jgi:hypothetical protein